MEGETSYSWLVTQVSDNLSGYTNSGTGNIPEQTINNSSSSAGTIIYTVTPTSADDCEGDPFTVTVIVNPEPQINNVTQAICNGESYTYSPVNGVNGVVPSGVTYSWDAPSSTDTTVQGTSGTNQTEFTTGIIENDDLNVAATLTYTVTPTSADNCEGEDFTVTITVNPEPQINSFAETICEGEEFTSITPENDTDGVVPTGTTYSWEITSSNNITGGSSGSGTTIPGSVLQNASNSPQDLIYTVTPTSADNCEGEGFTVTITVNPTAQVVQPDNITLCHGDITDIEFLTLNQGGDTSYSWEVVVTESDDIGPITDQGSGEGNINLAVENDTFDILTATIEVTPTFTNDDVLCEGPPKEFTITVIPNVYLIPINDITICNGETLEGVDFETVLTNAVARGFDRSLAEEKLDELSNEGTLHEPRFGWFRIVA